MTASYALLDDRSLLHLTGKDAGELLERLVTSTLPQDDHALKPSALLSPQGKVQFAFLLTKVEDGYLLDCHGTVCADLLKRLKLYRLRAKVDFADLSHSHAVVAGWGPGAMFSTALALRSDERGRPGGYDLGLRAYLPKEAVSDVALVPATDWHRLRIAAGVAEQGADYATGDVFPSDINLDQIDGVSYSKGCFVGQEVVSRMYHRNSMRRRTVVVSGKALAATKDLIAEGRSTGTLTSVSDTQALARVRVDRLAAAVLANQPLTVDGAAVSVTWPDWLGAPADHVRVAADDAV